MMIQRGLRVFNRNQNGFTLVELIIAIAVTALICSAVTIGVYQVVKINAMSTNHQIAIAQVQNATNSISRDAQQAQNIIAMTYNNVVIMVNGSNQIIFNLTANPNGDKLALYWVAWDDSTKHNTTHKVIYYVNNNVLNKDIYLALDSNPFGPASTTVVANNVTSASGNWNTYTHTLTLTMQVDVGVGNNLVTEIRTLQIIPRPAQ
jgi:prepilin-type N-terminal cleavage/methylation domain-containing protein